MRPREIFVIILVTVGVMVHTQYSYNLAYNDQCLDGYEVRSLSMSEAVDCFLACIEDCLCLAFQIHGNICELLSTTKLMTPSALFAIPSCSNYDVVVRIGQSLLVNDNCNCMHTGLQSPA